jgi:hypothetical protein
VSPVQFRRAPDDGMGRCIPPHEPSVEIIVDPSAAALVKSGSEPDFTGVLEAESRSLEERPLAARFFKAPRAKGIQETIDMSAKPNLAAKDVKSEVALRAYMLRGVEFLTEVEELSDATELEMVEGMQFERGYN